MYQKAVVQRKKNLQTLCWKCNRSKSDKIIS
ncbi:MAG: HNH endonuclease [Coprococcus sp.]